MTLPPLPTDVNRPLPGNVADLITDLEARLQAAGETMQTYNTSNADRLHDRLFDDLASKVGSRDAQKVLDELYTLINVLYGKTVGTYVATENLLLKVQAIRKRLT